MSLRLLIVFVAAAIAVAEPVPTAQQRSVFKSGRDVISVDVVVRDKSGAVVRGLTAADFEVREDGRPQDVVSFSFEEISTKPPAAIESAGLLAGVEATMAEDAGRAAPAKPAAAPVPLTSDMVAGRRLITIVFDVSSMQPEDVQRAVDGATKYVNETMSAADLVAVATIGSTLTGTDGLHTGSRCRRSRARDARVHRGHRHRGSCRQHHGDRRSGRRGDGR